MVSSAMDGDPDLTPTLEEAAQRRSDLHDALVGVEQAISRPAVGREVDWTERVVLQLEHLARAIDDHIEVTERPDGLYEEITHRAPRVANKMARLRDEHPELREGAAQAIARLRDPGIGERWPLEEARDDLQRLLGKIVRHRQLGADLVWEAYNLDIGGLE